MRFLIVAVISITFGADGVAQTIIGVPSARVPNSGTLSYGLGLTSQRGPESESADGAAAISFAFAPTEGIFRYQVSTVITSLTDDFGDSGYLRFKVGTEIPIRSNALHVAGTIDRFVPWGDAKHLDEVITFAIGTSFEYDFRYLGQTFPVSLVAGFGSDLSLESDRYDFFSGIGVTLSPRLDMSFSTFGGTVNAGFSLKSNGFRLNSFLADSVVSFAFADVFDDQGRRRLVVSWGKSIEIGKGK